jgi:hypothetical protein
MRWVALALVLLVVGYFGARSRKYGRLFADAHWLAVARAAGDLKTAALERIGVGVEAMPQSAEDPRVFVSEHGLVVVYTISRDGDAFLHECSVSLAGDVTPGAVGATFGALLVNLFALPVSSMLLRTGPTTVHHVVGTLRPDAHAELASRPVPEVSASDLPELRRIAFSTRDSLYSRRAP